tara:strand:+ start:308 stop:589 length:282 start_codon:yes stop_codon:yes gene_type:complete
MEWTCEPQEIEQAKIFAAMKELYNLSKGETNRFKRVKHLSHRLTSVLDWDESAYSRFLEGDYFTLKCKSISGKLIWIAIAKHSKRQYRVIMKK